MHAAGLDRNLQSPMIVETRKMETRTYRMKWSTLLAKLKMWNLLEVSDMLQVNAKQSNKTTHTDVLSKNVPKLQAWAELCQEGD